MKMFKFELPEDIKKALLTFESITLKNGTILNQSILVNDKKEFTEEEIGIKIAYGHPKDYFVEIIPKEDLFEMELDKLMSAVNNLTDEFDDDVAGHMIAIYSSYRPTMYFKKTDVICAINDNAQEGIQDNLRSHLKNKMQGNEFVWSIGELFYDDLQAVYKFYYYDENYRHTTSSGAGTLTGWLLAEEIEKRAKDKTVITLNNNYRLSESFFDRIKG